MAISLLLRSLVALGIILLVHTVCSANPETRLFTELPPGADLPEGVEAKLAALKNDRRFKNAKLLRMRELQATLTMLRTAAIGSTNAPVTLALPAGREMEARGTLSERPNGQFTWIGQARLTNRDSRSGSFVLTVGPTGILGTISVPGGTYELSSEGSGFVSLVELNESGVRPDHPPQFRQRQNSLEQRPRKQEFSVQQTSTSDPLRILVVYTPAAKRMIENERSGVRIDDWITQRMAEANAANVRSNTGVSFELAQSHLVDYKESGDWDTDRDRFFNKADGFMDDVVRLRDDAFGDVVVLLFTSSGYCGEVDVIFSPEARAYAVVDVDRGCTLKYTFTHEVGHLYGAEHDVANASRPPKYAHGHGFIYKDAWRTMMAYAHKCNPCTRQLAWSSPSIYLDKNPMGSKDKHDNARVLRSNASILSAYRAAPKSP